MRIVLENQSAYSHSSWRWRLERNHGGFLDPARWVLVASGSRGGPIRAVIEARWRRRKIEKLRALGFTQKGDNA